MAVMPASRSSAATGSGDESQTEPGSDVAAIAAGTMVVAACSGSTSSSGSPSGNVPSPTRLAAVTPAGTKPVSSVVWATNRDVSSLDPIYSGGYPEYTTDSLMCESLLRQAPDGSLQPGLATVANPSPTTLVFTLRPGVKFWDGHPVTSADVVYSLDRAADPKLGGYYVSRLDRIASITATSPAQVTVRLTQPDYWLEGSSPRCRGSSSRRASPKRRARTTGPRPGRSCAPARTCSSRGPQGLAWSRSATRTTGTPRSARSSTRSPSRASPTSRR